MFHFNIHFISRAAGRGRRVPGVALQLLAPAQRSVARAWRIFAVHARWLLVCSIAAGSAMSAQDAGFTQAPPELANPWLADTALRAVVRGMLPPEIARAVEPDLLVRHCPARTVPAYAAPPRAPAASRRRLRRMPTRARTRRLALEARGGFDRVAALRGALRRRHLGHALGR